VSGATNQTIPNLGPATSLAGSELVWINQAGVDKRSTLSQIAALAGGGGGSAGLSVVVAATNINPLKASTFYGVQTNLGPVTLTLPPLVSATLIFVGDVGYDAGTNNITINAAGADQIAVFSTIAGSTAITISDTWLLLFGVPGSYWRGIPFGI
jgi:hypothetical protein